MTVAIANSGAAYGTQTAVIGTEHSLATITAAGVYQLRVSVANLADGDAVELRWKTKAKPGGTAQTIDVASYSDAQPTDRYVVFTVPIPLDATTGYLEFTLKQVRGTGRNYDFAIVSI